jgi:hypothetical protein
LARTVLLREPGRHTCCGTLNQKLYIIIIIIIIIIMDNNNMTIIVVPTVIVTVAIIHHVWWLGWDGLWLIQVVRVDPRERLAGRLPWDAKSCKRASGIMVSENGVNLGDAL